jgi:hypothetical protein
MSLLMGRDLADALDVHLREGRDAPWRPVPDTSPGPISATGSPLVEPAPPLLESDRGEPWTTRT